MASIYAKTIAQLEKTVTEQTVTLRFIADKQNEMLSLLRTVNGRVRSTEEATTSLETWRENHEAREGRQDEQIGGLWKRLHGLSAANALLTTIGTTIATWWGRQQ